jgi:preprotein translocase subunit SecF
MIKMKRGQVSFEYSILFAFVFLMFLVFATAFFFGIKKVDSAEYKAESIAKEIKIKAITASLSEYEYESTVAIPKTLDGKEIIIEINEDPDNLLFIKDKLTGRTITRAFLPVINDVSGISKENEFDLKIVRMGNEIKLEE